MEKLFDLLKIKHRAGKADREPQSELEENKDELKFESEVMKEVRKFIEGLSNSKIVAVADLKDL